jgi:hypothetical protein
MDAVPLASVMFLPPGMTGLPRTYGEGQMGQFDGVIPWVIRGVYPTFKQV